MPMRWSGAVSGDSHLTISDVRMTTPAVGHIKGPWMVANDLQRHSLPVRCCEHSHPLRVRAMPSQCSFCGHGNPPGAKYCNECGSPLNFKPCAACGAVNEGSAPGCHKC